MAKQNKTDQTNLEFNVNVNENQGAKKLKDIADSLKSLQVSVANLKIDGSFVKALTDALAGTDKVRNLAAAAGKGIADSFTKAVVTAMEGTSRTKGIASRTGGDIAKEFINGLKKELEMPITGKGANEKISQRIAKLFTFDGKGIGTTIGNQIAQDLTAGINQGIEKAMKGIVVPTPQLTNVNITQGGGGGGAKATGRSLQTNIDAALRKAIKENMKASGDYSSNSAEFRQQLQQRLDLARNSPSLANAELGKHLDTLLTKELERAKAKVDKAKNDIIKYRDSMLAELNKGDSVRLWGNDYSLLTGSQVDGMFKNAGKGVDKISKEREDYAKKIAKLSADSLKDQKAIYRTLRGDPSLNRDAMEKLFMDTSAMSEVAGRVKKRESLAKEYQKLFSYNTYAEMMKQRGQLVTKNSSEDLRAMIFDEKNRQMQEIAKIQAEAEAKAAAKMQENLARSVALKKVTLGTTMGSLNASIASFKAMKPEDLKALDEQLNLEAKLAQKQKALQREMGGDTGPDPVKKKQSFLQKILGIDPNLDKQENFKNTVANVRDSFGNLKEALGIGQLPNFKDAFGQMFEGISGMATSAMEKITGAFKMVGVGVLTMIGAMAGIGVALKSSVMDVMTTTEKYRGFNIALLGMVKTQANVDRMMAASFKVAENLPVSYEQVFQTTKAMSLIAPLRPMMTNPKTSEKTLKDVWQIVTTLSQIEPEWGVQGAMFSLREMMSGDFLSLKRRFEMPVDTFKTESGKSLRSVRNNPAELLSGLAYNMRDLMPEESLEMTSKQLGPVLAKMLGEVDKFKQAIGNSGIYDAIVGDLRRVGAYLKEFADSKEATAFAQRISDSFERGYNSILRGISNIVKMYDTLTGSKSDMDTIVGPMETAISLLERYAKGMDVLSRIVGDKKVQSFIKGMWDDLKNSAGNTFDFIVGTIKVVIKDFQSAANSGMEIISSITGQSKNIFGSFMTPEIAGRGLFYAYLFGPGNILQAGVGFLMTGIASIGVAFASLQFTLSAIGAIVSGISATTTTIKAISAGITFAEFATSAATLSGTLVLIVASLAGIVAMIGAMDEAFTNSKIFGWVETFKQFFGMGKNNPKPLADLEAKASSAREDFASFSARQVQNIQWQPENERFGGDYILSGLDTRLIDPAKNLQGALKQAKEEYDKMLNPQTDMAKGFFSGLDKFGNETKTAFGNYVKTLETLNSQYADAAQKATELTTNAKSVNERIQDAITGAMGAVKKATGGETSQGKGLLGSLVDGVKGYFGTVNSATPGNSEAVAKIDAWFAKKGKGGLFEGQGSSIVSAAEKAKMDPYYFASLLAEETGYGKHVIPGSFNPGNMKAFHGEPFVTAKDNALGTIDKYIKFGNIGEGIEANAWLLSNNYANKGLTTISGISGKYAEDKNHNSKIASIMGDLIGSPVDVNRQVIEGVKGFIKPLNSASMSVEDLQAEYRAKEKEAEKEFGFIKTFNYYRKQFEDAKTSANNVITGGSDLSRLLGKDKDKIRSQYSDFVKGTVADFEREMETQLNGNSTSGGGQSAYIGRKAIDQVKLGTFGYVQQLGSIQEIMKDMAKNDQNPAISLMGQVGGLVSNLTFPYMQRRAESEAVSFDSEEMERTNRLFIQNEKAAKTYFEFLKMSELEWKYAGNATQEFDTRLSDHIATWAYLNKEVSSSENSARFSQIAKDITFLGKSWESATKDLREYSYVVKAIKPGMPLIKQAANVLGGTAGIPGVGMAMEVAGKQWERAANEIGSTIEHSDKLRSSFGVFDKFTKDMKQAVDEYQKLDWTKMNELIAKGTSLVDKDRATRKVWFDQYEKNLELSPQSAGASFATGIQSSLSDMKNWSETMFEIGKGLVGDLQSNFQSGFFDFMSQKTKNLGDMFRSLADTIKNTLLQVIAKLASKFVIDLVFNTSGSSGGGGGNLLSSVLSMFSGGGQQQSSGGGFNVGSLLTAGLGMLKGGSSAGDLLSTAANWISGGSKSGGKSSGGLSGLASSFMSVFLGKSAASGNLMSKLTTGWNSIFGKGGFLASNPWVLPAVGAISFLTQPGRLFGGTDDHTQEARAAQQNSNNTWAEYVAGRSKYAQGYAYAGRENINNLLNYSFPQGVYSETESGNGIWAKHTHTGQFDDSNFRASLVGYYKLLDDSAKAHFKAQYDLEKLKQKDELAGLQREIALKQEYFDIINKMYQDAMKAGDWTTTNDLRDKVYEAQNDLWKLGDSLLDLAKAANEARFNLDNYISTGRGTAKILFAQNELGELRNRFAADMNPSSSTIRANLLSGGSDLSGTLAALDMQEGPKLVENTKEWYERKLEILQKEKELSDMIYAQVTGYHQSLSENSSTLMGLNLTSAQRAQYMSSTTGMYGLQNSSMFGNVNYTKKWTTQEVNPEYQMWINKWNASGDGGVAGYNNIAEQIATWAASPIEETGPNGTQTDMEKFLTWVKITVGGEMVEKNLQTDVKDGNYDPTNVNTALSRNVQSSKESFLNFLKNPQYMAEVLQALGFSSNIVDFAKQFTRDATGMLVSADMNTVLTDAGISQTVEVGHSAQERVKTWGQFTQSSMFQGMSDDEKKRFMYITQVQRGNTAFDPSISYKDFASQVNITEMIKSLMGLSDNAEIIDWEAVGQYWTDSIKRQLEAANIQSLQNDITDMWSEMMMSPFDIQSKNINKLIQKINEADKTTTEYWELQKQLTSVQVSQAKEIFGVVSSGAISGASKIGIGGTAYYGGAGLYEAYLRLTKENPAAAQAVYDKMQDSMVGYNNRREIRRNMAGMSSSAMRMLGNSAYLPTKFTLASRDINYSGPIDWSNPNFLYQTTDFGNFYNATKNMTAGQRDDYSYQQDLKAAQIGASDVSDLYRRGVVDKSKMEEAMKVIADIQTQRAISISSSVDELARTGFASSDQLNAIGLESGSSQLESLRREVGAKQLKLAISNTTAGMSDRAMKIAFGMGTVGSATSKAIQPYGAFSDVLRAEYGMTSGQRADYLYQQNYDQSSNALKVSAERFGKGSDEYNTALQNFSQVVLDRASDLGGALDELLTTGFITKADITGVTSMAEVEKLQLKARQGQFQGGILGAAGGSSLDTNEMTALLSQYASLSGINGTQTRYYQSFGPGQGEWRTMNRATSMAGMEANAMLNFYRAGDQQNGGKAFADFADASTAFSIEAAKTKIKNADEGSTAYFDAQNELFQLMIQRAEHLKQKAEESSSKIEDMLNSIDETMKLRIAEERKSQRGDVYFIDMGTRSASQQLDDLLAKINTNDPAAAELVRKFREKMAQNQSASR